MSTLEAFIKKKLSGQDLRVLLQLDRPQIDPLLHINNEEYIKHYKVDLFDSLKGNYHIYYVNSLEGIIPLFTLLRSELIKTVDDVEITIYSSSDNWILLYIEELYPNCYFTLEAKVTKRIEDGPISVGFFFNIQKATATIQRDIIIQDIRSWFTD